MMKASVPIHHKEDHQRQRQIHHEKHKAAGTGLLQLVQYPFARLIPTGMPNQTEAHHGKRDIISRQRAEPEAVMPKAHTELQQRVSGIEDQRSVKSCVDSQSRITPPEPCIFVFRLEGLETCDEIRNFEAPHGQGVSGKNVRNDGRGRFRSQKHHRIHEKSDGDGDKRDHHGDMGKQEGFAELFPIHIRFSVS